MTIGQRVRYQMSSGLFAGSFGFSGVIEEVLEDGRYRVRGEVGEHVIANENELHTIRKRKDDGKNRRYDHEHPCDDGYDDI